MDKAKKFQEIIDNHTNGNISDFNKQIRALSKYDLIELLGFMYAFEDFWGSEEVNSDIPISETLLALSRALHK